jgi:4-amino-4-deoxy-L-arabinose transferase-like glycosyltransferase
MLSFGINVFAIRFVSVVIGILAVPLMYRSVVAMFARDPARHFLGLIAGAGLSFSFWYIAISRSGFRASLFLLLFILTVYLFWQGWQHHLGFSSRAGWFESHPTGIF